MDNDRAVLLLTLPVEILNLLISYVPMAGLKNLSLCSKATYAVASNDVIWRSRWKHLLLTINQTDLEFESKSLSEIAAERRELLEAIPLQSDFKQKYKAVIRARTIIDKHIQLYSRAGMVA